MPKSSCPRRAARPQALAAARGQRSDSSMNRAPRRFATAGYGVHSSNTMATSESSARCTSMETLGAHEHLEPSTGERKRTPSSVSLRIAARLKTW